MFLENSDENEEMLEEGATSSRGEPAAITDTGCERDLNEDRYAVVESQSGTAWMVCDGMGGQTGGELAAQLAIDAIRRDLENLPPRTAQSAIKSSILEANRIVVLRRQNQAFSQMGTTVVAANFLGPEVVIANVGDCRAYLIRDGAIQQLTVDHTYVQELVDTQQIEPEEALSHPQAHILTRCLGAEPGLEVDITRFWIWDSAPDEPNDLLLLCSDGLYSLVNEGEIASIASTSSPSRACVQLVELAKERGGYDNITLVVIPLDGQLRTEQPEGYSPDQYLRATSTAVAPVESVSREHIVRFLVVLGILSVVALFFALMIVALMIRI